MTNDVDMVMVTMEFSTDDPSALAPILAKYVVMSRGHEGCRNIDLCSSTTTPGRLTIVQKWESLDGTTDPFRFAGHGRNGRGRARSSHRASPHGPAGPHLGPRPLLSSPPPFRLGAARREAPIHGPGHRSAAPPPPAQSMLASIPAP